MFQKLFFPVWVLCLLDVAFSVATKAIPIMEWHLLTQKSVSKSSAQQTETPLPIAHWKKWEYGRLYQTKNKPYDFWSALIEMIGGNLNFSLKSSSEIDNSTPWNANHEEWSWYFGKFGFTSFFWGRECFSSVMAKENIPCISSEIYTHHSWCPKWSNYRENHSSSREMVMAEHPKN